MGFGSRPGSSRSEGVSSCMDDGGREHIRES